MSVRPESECRRPDANWEDTVPIVLADGQAWHFPKPFVDIVPTFTDGKASMMFESELQPFFNRMDTAETGIEENAARLEMERYMLLKLYDLKDEELPHLLRWRVGSEVDEERRKAIMNVAWGVGPKPTPGGESSQ